MHRPPLMANSSKVSRKVIVKGQNMPKVAEQASFTAALLADASKIWRGADSPP